MYGGVYCVDVVEGVDVEGLSVQVVEFDLFFGWVVVLGYVGVGGDEIEEFVDFVVLFDVVQ